MASAVQQLYNIAFAFPDFKHTNCGVWLRRSYLIAWRLVENSTWDPFADICDSIKLPAGCAKPSGYFSGRAVCQAPILQHQHRLTSHLANHYFLRSADLGRLLGPTQQSRAAPGRASPHQAPPRLARPYHTRPCQARPCPAGPIPLFPIPP